MIDSVLTPHQYEARPGSIIHYAHGTEVAVILPRTRLHPIQPGYWNPGWLVDSVYRHKHYVALSAGQFRCVGCPITVDVVKV